MNPLTVFALGVYVGGCVNALLVEGTVGHTFRQAGAGGKVARILLWPLCAVSFVIGGGPR